MVTRNPHRDLYIQGSKLKMRAIAREPATRLGGSHRVSMSCFSSMTCL